MIKEKEHISSIFIVGKHSIVTITSGTLSIQNHKRLVCETRKLSRCINIHNFDINALKVLELSLCLLKNIF